MKLCTMSCSQILLALALLLLGKTLADDSSEERSAPACVAADSSSESLKSGANDVVVVE